MAEGLGVLWWEVCNSGRRCPIVGGDVQYFLYVVFKAVSNCNTVPY